MSLLDAVQRLLDAPIHGSVGSGGLCEVCAEFDISSEAGGGLQCPWCGYPVDDSWNGHHPLTCPLYQLQREVERATINNPPPPKTCCMARECPTGPDGARVDCGGQAK